MGLLCVRVCARLCVCVSVWRESLTHSVSACVLSFRAFGLVSVSFAFRFRACVLSEVEILCTSFSQTFAVSILAYCMFVMMRISLRRTDSARPDGLSRRCTQAQQHRAHFTMTLTIKVLPSRVRP